MMPFINDIISFLVINSIFSIIVFLFIWPLRRFLFIDNLFWKQALLLLVLIRLFLPIQSWIGFDPLNWVSFTVDFSYETGALVENAYLAEEILKRSGTHEIVEQSLFIKTFLAGLWLFGAIISFLIFFKFRLKFVKIAKQSIHSKSPLIAKYTKKWQQQLKISRNVQIAESTQTTVPFTYGVLRPKIIIPHSIVVNSSNLQLEIIIAHEMAHIKRYDDLQLLLLVLIQSVYFFNPISWFVIKELGSLREQHCDRLVLDFGNISYREYGLSLLKISGNSLNPSLVFISAMTGNAKRIKNRINSLKKGSNMKLKRMPAMYIMLFILTTILLSMGNAPQKTNKMSKESSKNKSMILIDFQNPLNKSKISSEFGKQINPITNKERHHNGIDLKSAKGTKIKAAESGTVSAAENRGNYGNLISITHKEGFKTRYAHLNKIAVKKGQKIAKGDVIGFVGNSGVATGPHLHFEIHLNGKPVNPKDYIKF